MEQKDSSETKREGWAPWDDPQPYTVSSFPIDTSKAVPITDPDRLAQLARMRKRFYEIVEARRTMARAREVLGDDFLDRE